MSEEQTPVDEPYADLADRLAHPPAELGARVALLDEAAAQLQAALADLDEV